MVVKVDFLILGVSALYFSCCDVFGECECEIVQVFYLDVEVACDLGTEFDMIVVFRCYFFDGDYFFGDIVDCVGEVACGCYIRDVCRCAGRDVGGVFGEVLDEVFVGGELCFFDFVLDLIYVEFDVCMSVFFEVVDVLGIGFEVGVGLDDVIEGDFFGCAQCYG